MTPKDKEYQLWPLDVYLAKRTESADANHLQSTFEGKLTIAPGRGGAVYIFAEDDTDAKRLKEYFATWAPDMKPKYGYLEEFL